MPPEGEGTLASARVPRRRPSLFASHEHCSLYIRKQSLAELTCNAILTEKSLGTGRTGRRGVGPAATRPVGNLLPGMWKTDADQSAVEKPVL